MVMANMTSWLSPRKEIGHLYYDVSFLSGQSYGPGITRVVDNVFLSLKKCGSCSVTPVRCTKGKVTTSRLYEARTRNEEFDGIESRIEFSCNDQLLLPDGVWLLLEDMKQMVEKARSEGCAVNAFLYDLIPINYPHFTFTTKVFTEWIHLLLGSADKIICISRTVAKELADYYKKQWSGKRKLPLEVYWVHLGTCSNSLQENMCIRSSLRDFLENGKVFLMVGTVCRRKGQDIALRAFHKIFEECEGHDAKLLMIGKDGGDGSALDAEKLGDGVLWVKDANDTELRYSYQKATGLIEASIVEGYGLPVVEAARFGLPLLCSDIPVFHEITQGYANFFPCGNEQSLKDLILSMVSGKEMKPSKNIRMYSWDETAMEVLDILSGRKVPYRMLM